MSDPRLVLRTVARRAPRPPAAGLTLLAAATLIACAPPAEPATRPAALPRTTPAPAQLDTTLQRALEGLVSGFAGDVGIYVRHLPSGRSAAVRADEIFPTASMVKLPILVGTFDAAHRGQFRLQDRWIYTDSLLYPGEDLTGMLEDSSSVPVSKLVMLMMTLSDNTASLWLQGRVGGATVNRWLAEHGFDSTRINSRVDGRRPDWQRYGWGQTTPREMSELLVMIREGRAVGQAESEEMYRALTRSYWDGEALSQLPPWVQAASKQGMVDRSRSEAVLVNAPSGDYVFTVITKNQTDTSYVPSNEGYLLLRSVSALLWRHFEPDSPWRPDPHAAGFKPGEVG